MSAGKVTSALFSGADTNVYCQPPGPLLNLSHKPFDSNSVGLKRSAQ